MSEQRIDTAGAAATGADADPGEGGQGAQLGTTADAAGTAVAEGSDTAIAGQGPGRGPGSTTEMVEGDTEGERSMRAAAENRPD